MDEALRALAESEGPLAYLALLLSAAVEYVFPPFPGDTVTLFGAFLVSSRGWNPVAVLTAVTLGSVVGATIDYYIGIRLARNGGEAPRGWLARRWARSRERLAPAMERLRRRGASYIVVNRFLPGIRAFFFVAAGMARIPLGPVLFYATVSALVWNGIIVALGHLLALSWDRLQRAGEIYATAAWVLIAVVAAALLGRWLRRRKARGGADRGAP